MFFTLLIPHLAETAVGVQGYHFEWILHSFRSRDLLSGRGERERSMMHGEGHRSSSGFRRREQKGEDLLQLFPAAQD